MNRRLDYAKPDCRQTEVGTTFDRESAKKYDAEHVRGILSHLSPNDFLTSNRESLLQSINELRRIQPSELSDAQFTYD